MDEYLMIKALPSAIAGIDPYPRFCSEQAAGMDLIANIPQSLCLHKGKITLVGTGITIALPNQEYMAFVFARSGLASKYGITMANGVGLIDADYRGEIICPLINLGSEDYSINPGERIAQLVVMKNAHLPIEKVKSLPDSKRGDNGFGSTGIQS